MLYFIIEALHYSTFKLIILISKGTHTDNEGKTVISQIRYPFTETAKDLKNISKLDNYVLNERECQKALMNTATLKSGIYSLNPKLSLQKQLPQQSFPPQTTLLQQPQSKLPTFWDQVKLKLSKTKASHFNHSHDSSFYLQDFINKEMQKIVLEKPCSHNEIIKNSQLLQNISQSMKQERKEKCAQSHQSGDRENTKTSSQESSSHFLSQHNTSTLTPAQKSLSLSASSLSKLYF